MLLHKLFCSVENWPVFLSGLILLSKFKANRKKIEEKIDSNKNEKFIMNEMQTRVINSQTAYEFIQSMR